MVCVFVGLRTLRANRSREPRAQTKYARDLPSPAPPHATPDMLIPLHLLIPRAALKFKKRGPSACKDHICLSNGVGAGGGVASLHLFVCSTQNTRRRTILLEHHQKPQKTKNAVLQPLHIIPVTRKEHFSWLTRGC